MMPLSQSTFYGISYEALTRYIRLSEEQKQKHSHLYSQKYHAEAVEVLQDRIERAYQWDRQAWDKLMGAPIIVNNKEAFAISRIESPNYTDFAIGLFFPRDNDTLDLYKSKSFSFNKKGMGVVFDLFSHTKKSV